MDTKVKRFNASIATANTSIDLPKELLATVVLTTNMLLKSSTTSSKKSTKTCHSHREHPPDFCNHVIENLSSAFAYTEATTASLNIKSCNKFVHPQDHQAQQPTAATNLANIDDDAILKYKSTTARSTCANAALRIGRIAATFSTTLPIVLKASHRRNKSNSSSSDNKGKTTIAELLRQLFKMSNNNSRSCNSNTSGRDLTPTAVTADKAPIAAVTAAIKSTTTLPSVTAVSATKRFPSLAAEVSARATAAARRRYKITAAATITMSSAATISSTSRTGRFRLLPSLGATSFFTLLTLVCLETVLLSTMSNCAKTFYMHWNTSNSM